MVSWNNLAIYIKVIQEIKKWKMLERLFDTNIYYDKHTVNDFWIFYDVSKHLFLVNKTGILNGFSVFCEFYQGTDFGTYDEVQLLHHVFPFWILSKTWCQIITKFSFSFNFFLNIFFAESALRQIKINVWYFDKFYYY